MKPESFISGKLRFNGRLAAGATAVSFFVMIVAVAISSGFREEIRNGISAVSGDIILSGDEYVSLSPQLLETVEGTEGVTGVSPVMYSPAIARKGDLIQGMLVKGVETMDSSLHVRIPASLARALSLKVGDGMLAYFVGEKVKVRRFIVSEVYRGLVDTDENMLVYAPMEDIRRIAGWEDDRASAIEVRLSDKWRGRLPMREKALEIGSLTSSYAVSAADKYARIFDWLDLIDLNVVTILVLMTLVAGFNMISGLLIMLFRNISTIGILKSLGMKDRSIAAVFIRVAARTVALGMAVGNAAALLFCLVQGKTHIIGLNPENYFVSFVPVRVNVPFILAADLISFAAILLMLLVPSLFIARVDPAQTVKSE